MNFLTENKYIFTLTTLFLTMYAPSFAPTLPPYIINFFNNWLFRGLIMFLVVYYSNKNALTSLIVTLLFFGLHYVSKQYLVLERFIKYNPSSGCVDEKKIKHKQGIFSNMNPKDKPLYNTINNQLKSCN